LWWG